MMDRKKFCSCVCFGNNLETTQIALYQNVRGYLFLFVAQKWGNKFHLGFTVFQRTLAGNICTAYHIQIYVKLFISFVNGRLPNYTSLCILRQIYTTQKSRLDKRLVLEYDKIFTWLIILVFVAEELF